jgi:lipid-A-disaccharide synthase
MTGDPLIFVIAGEPSGDLLGGRLMAALMEETAGRVRFAGIGGESMADQGLRSLFPMAELSLMGLAEIVPHIPRLLRRIRETARAVDEARPAAVVTIDSPDFTRRVARRITNRAIPRIHYVAPTVWAWRPRRAKGFARDFDHLLALLPFEPPWFERAGLPCRFVGHPVVESGADKGDGAAFRARHGIDPQDTLVCVLPGSRRGEVGRLAGDFGIALGMLARKHARLKVVVPTVEGVSALVEARCAVWPVPVELVHGQAEKFDAMAASNLAMAASGTVALELALARVPHVVAYRVAPLTYFIVRRLLTNPDQYGNLVNIILDRQVVPEFVQGNCRPERLAHELERLMGPDGATQIEATAFAMARLGQDGPPPGRRAARAVLDILGAAET